MKTWKEIGRWNVGSPDGNSEEYILERSENGDFRIKNDFGNISIEMELMSAVDFIKNVYEAMQDEIEIDIDGYLNDFDDNDDDDENDCP